MIHFPKLRTYRLNLQLKEISIGNALSCAVIPLGHHEKTCTNFLKAIIDYESSDNVIDPLLWTVQERNLTVCHYLASIFIDGPNFQVGNGYFFDYLDTEHDFISPAINLGKIGGDEWIINHLLGAQSETIERIWSEINGLHGYGHWFIGSMAAQLMRTGEEIIDPLDSKYDNFLIERIKTFTQYPESDFQRLSIAYMEGKRQLDHLFRYDYDDSGIIILPLKESSELAPARFLISAAFTTTTKRLAR